MDEIKSFAQKLNFLRAFYGLSAADLAYILSLKSRSSVTNIETGRALPSYELLVAISNLFAVKMDWLAGRTDVAYNEVIISNIEEKLLDVQLADDTVFRDIAPHFYLDSSLIKVGFSLADRAKVIFVLQFLKAVTEKHPELLHRSVDVPFLQSLAKQKCVYTKWRKTPDELYMQLLYYIAVMFYKSTSD